jgi:hypothetical protein
MTWVFINHHHSKLKYYNNCFIICFDKA